VDKEEQKFYEAQAKEQKLLLRIQTEVQIAQAAFLAYLALTAAFTFGIWQIAAAFPTGTGILITVLRYMAGGILFALTLGAAYSTYMNYCKMNRLRVNLNNLCL
jgi:hypothetical protein